MSANEASLDNWINEAIATQLPELRMSLSWRTSELLAKLVRKWHSQQCIVLFLA